ncbi:MAG: DUF1800 family protein [Candidatus Kapaibacterium sp.]|jgi:uncharacterized protein (DUF1800 family)
MNRRHFFERILLGDESPQMQVSSGLEPYKPTEKLSREDAVHLLGRTTFGATFADVDKAVTMTTSQAVDALFVSASALPPPSWSSVDPATENFPDAQARQSEYYKRYYQTQQWWFARIRTSPFSIQEKLTLFWHSFLSSDYIKVYIPQYMVVQNQLFRTNAWGNIKTLVRSLVSDPAMLIYLDNVVSIKGNPNENFARELLELFSLGVNNYTEEDVVESARALTGWRIKGLRGEFYQEYWDNTTKTFMGKTGPLNADDIVNTIFEKDACALYFARRLYKAFVYDVPDEKLVAELAQVLRSNNYELKPTLSVLLKSAHFFDREFRGSLIKSPIEFVAGLQRQLAYSEVPDVYSVSAATALNLELLNPPTVEGWKGGHLWLNTNLYPLRQRIVEAVVEGKRQDTNASFAKKPDVIAFSNQFATVNNAANFVRDVAAFLVTTPIGPKEHEFLLESLLQGARDYEWNITMPNAEFRVRELLKAVMTLPEYQLY